MDIYPILQLWSYPPLQLWIHKENRMSQGFARGMSGIIYSRLHAPVRDAIFAASQSELRSWSRWNSQGPAGSSSPRARGPDARGRAKGVRSNQSRSVARAQRSVPEAQRHEEATDFALTCAVDTGFVSHCVEVDDDGRRKLSWGAGSAEDDGKVKACARNRRRRLFGQRVGAGLATLRSRAGRASLTYAPLPHCGARRRSHAELELGLGPGGGIRRWCGEEGRRRAHGWPAAS